MSKAKWGGGVIFFVGIIAQFAAVTDTQRRWILVISGAALVLYLIGWMFSKPKNGSGVVSKISGHHVGRQNVQTAGRDAYQVQHHHHVPATEPLGMRVDASSLRQFKRHRDEGETLLSKIAPGDGEKGGKWGEIDGWWMEAQALANRNVFQPFISLQDLARLTEPWPDVDKLDRLTAAVESGQINDAGDDLNLYGTHWERLERVRQLIGIIESPRNG